MKFLFFLLLQAVLIANINGLLHSKKKVDLISTGDHHNQAIVKIYSNLAEIIQPLGKLPLEFSAEDWTDIRADSITLVGTNVIVTQQSTTEQKKSLDGTQVHVRSPSSSSSQTKFVPATLIDERNNLVKILDKDISKDPIFLTVSSDQIVYNEEPPKSKFYVNFTYNTTDAVSVSYLRSNLNWKTRYQLNLFDESTNPILISMADIRNDGKSTVHIEHAELLGGDINLRMSEQPEWHKYHTSDRAEVYASAYGAPGMSSPPPTPTVTQGQELAGLYVFPISQPFSIDGKTNYLLPMFRPKVTIERYGSISKTFYSGASSTRGKVRRSYCLSSDRFLSKGNCIIREFDRLVGETNLPDLAANDKYDFSIGEDSDVIHKENITLESSRSYNETSLTNYREVHLRTKSVYNINLLLKNFKKNRSIKVKYQQDFLGQSVKFPTKSPLFTTEGSSIKCTVTLSANEEKLLTYTVELVN